MAQAPLAHMDLLGRHLPAFGGGRHQHGSGRGAGMPHLLVGIGNGGTAAGALHAERQVLVALGIRRSPLHGYIAPVGVEFFGHQGGEAGVGALSHFQMLGDHDHRAIGADAHEGIGEKSSPSLAATSSACTCPPRISKGDR
ncbi:hypothetical protein A8U91_01395 [Halomonas elongata]|uniref:Uncharacterized protein n=1 Tax=Halomonas elongata TaxID=2746 RepID=A0A1B8P482_HALEL|nr:hypothetical protein A8U91_01395 [Halomonas elongata]